MKRDIASGKLDKVSREVDDDIRAGRLRDMPCPPRTHRRFWEYFEELPSEVQALVSEKISAWAARSISPATAVQTAPWSVWSIRIGPYYRALARRHGDLVVWFWIGTHKERNNFIQQLR